MYSPIPFDRSIVGIISVASEKSADGLLKTESRDTHT